MRPCGTSRTFPTCASSPAVELRGAELPLERVAARVDLGRRHATSAAASDLHAKTDAILAQLVHQGFVPALGASMQQEVLVMPAVLGLEVLDGLGAGRLDRGRHLEVADGADVGHVAVDQPLALLGSVGRGHGGAVLGHHLLVIRMQPVTEPGLGADGLDSFLVDHIKRQDDRVAIKHF
jgi:hypothetical protein